MGRPRLYPDEFRHRAVRLVYEWRKDRDVAEGGLQAVADQLGVNRETLRRWVIEDEVASGDRWSEPGGAVPDPRVGTARIVS